MCWGTAFPSCLTGMMAFGCNAFLNSKKLFFSITTCLTTFTPPLVEPAEPPVKNKAKKIPDAKKLHMVKSAVTNPVVCYNRSNHEQAMSDGTFCFSIDHWMCNAGLQGWVLKEIDNDCHYRSHSDDSKQVVFEFFTLKYLLNFSL